MSSKEDRKTPKSGCTLKTPVQLIKRHSGPLDDILDEVNRDSKAELDKKTTALHNKDISSSSSGSTVGHFLHKPCRRLSHTKDREKKRERWLLTRKTWKYMTDAGRKLIPEGVQNKKDDIPKIHAHFQELCSSEPRFVLWRRKSSYPGAIRSSKRRLRQLFQHTGQQKQLLPQTVEQIENEEIQESDRLINLLQNHLKINESNKTTTLLGSKTVRPDQTSSPSAQRPSNTNPIKRVVGSSLVPEHQLEQLNDVEQLLERLKALQRSATTPIVDIPPDLITKDILKNKTLLRQIYNALKKQQLHRILTKHSHSNAKGFSRSLSALSLSLSNLNTVGIGVSGLPKRSTFDNNERVNNVRSFEITNSKSIPNPTKSEKANENPLRYPPTSLNIQKKSTPHQAQNVQNKKSKNTCGTQTNFIQLHEIKRLAEEYKTRKREELSYGSLVSDGEIEKSSQKPSLSHRKSSIDNEDVSQSVSDTIKRYLRMARKKSVHDSDGNRFKRVNYDRNLRNIRGKGEINPPGMDEGNSKAVQTLDAWPLIALDFIRGNFNGDTLADAHAEWQKNLDERIKNKNEFEQKMNEKKCLEKISNASRSCSSSSAPTSPTSPVSTSSEKSAAATSDLEKSSSHSNVASGGGLFHSSTQFLSNIWHGGGHQHSDNSNKNNILFDSEISEKYMQKSKSASNVGHIVSSKFLRARSKSQSRLPSTTFSPSESKWAPAAKCTWLSEHGVRLQLSDSLLQNLSDIETKYLKRIAMEKISELNVGININWNSNDKEKKRKVLQKKKAMTTNFFEIGRKDDRGKNISIFGSSLESCIENDNKKKSTQTSGDVKDRGSRSSISSLFRSGSENVRSCESLPSSTNTETIGTANRHSDCLRKSSSMLISNSQWNMEMRRKSIDYDPSEELPSEESHLKVPSFIKICIKYLEENGLHEVGLFRVSTSKKRIKQMREDFKTNLKKIQANTCPHDVATLLKEFLRDLPDPLLCGDLYSAFLQTQKIRNRRLQMEAISHLIKLLPTVHRDTLYVLLRFLARVAAHSDDVLSPDGVVYISGNKMDSNNLATVFAPNILRKKLEDENATEYKINALSAKSEHESMNDSINVIRTMIDHYEDLFRVPADLIDVAYSYMLDECPEQLFSLCEQQSASAKAEVNSKNFLSDHLNDEINLDSSVEKLHSRQSVTHENNALLRENVVFVELKNAKGSRRHADVQGTRYSARSSTDERRQSSPNVFPKENVISGSLQISGPKLVTDSDGTDLSRSVTENPEKAFPIPITTTTKLSKGLPIKDTAVKTSKPVDMKLKKLTNEPKLPASISSIGGAILRSKTADFERISQEQKPLIQKTSSRPISPSGQQLYKRQQLISSSKGINSS